MLKEKEIRFFISSHRRVNKEPAKLDGLARESFNCDLCSRSFFDEGTPLHTWSKKVNALALARSICSECDTQVTESDAYEFDRQNP